MRIGVLALQGAFIEHINILNSLGVDAIEIRKLSDLDDKFSGIVIPGGESSVMSKLLDDLNLRDCLLDMANSGVSFFGTCAGLILMSSDSGDNRCKPLGLIDCKVKRNAYGRQLGSFSDVADFKGIGEIPVTFIRGPIVEKCNKPCEILCRVNDKIVAVKQGNHFACSFHPELTNNKLVHRYFLDLCN